MINVDFVKADTRESCEQEYLIQKHGHVISCRGRINTRLVSSLYTIISGSDDYAVVIVIKMNNGDEFFCLLTEKTKCLLGDE